MQNLAKRKKPNLPTTNRHGSNRTFLRDDFAFMMIPILCLLFLVKSYVKQHDRKSPVTLSYVNDDMFWKKSAKPNEFERAFVFEFRSC